MFYFALGKQGDVCIITITYNVPADLVHFSKKKQKTTNKQNTT